MSAWASPSEVAARLDLRGCAEVLDALAALELTESRAHSRPFWIWHEVEASHATTTPRERSDQAEWLASGWGIVEEAAVNRSARERGLPLPLHVR